MNLEDVMQQVANQLDTIANLRVYAWPADSVSVPAGVIGYPEEIQFDRTYGRGMDSMTLPVWIVIGKASNRGTRSKVAGFVNGSGASSVKTVLEAGTYTALHTLFVARAEFDVITIGTSDYLAVKFTLDITGQGSG